MSSMTAKEFSLRDRFGTYNGMEVVSAEKGRAVARMEIRDEHKNGVGTVHGGVIFTLADLAFAAAANMGEDTVVSVNAMISYAKAGLEGVLLAEAAEVTRNAKLVTYDVKVKNGTGEIIAVFQGTGYVKTKRFVKD